jgi:hypothetical protein
MASRYRMVAAIGVAATLVVLGAPAHAKHAAVVASRIVPDMTAYATVTDVTHEGNLVTGTIVNRTPNALYDVKLLVAEPFRWKNQFHPGDDSPARGYVITYPQPVPPHGTAQLLYEVPPRPHRDDGHFETRVGVLSATSVPPA